MRNPDTRLPSRSLRRALPPRWLAAVCVALLLPAGVHWRPASAAATDLATVPVFSSTPPTVQVKPNIMFIMDDSGSMDWDYMPDQAAAFDRDSSSNLKFGHPSSHCNGVYYNPAITYTPPVYADGTSYPNADFYAAPRDGYGLTTGTVNLSTKFRSFSGDSEGAAYYYRYTGTQTSEVQKKYTDTNSVFYKECNSLRTSSTKHDGVNAVNTLFAKVTVSDTSGIGGKDERTNFANWYTYYRTRMNSMKTAAGLAFKSLDDKYRVGFVTLNDNVAPGFLNISDFATTQKTEFYKQLYGSNPSSGTPLRSTLSKIGRMYANKISSINGVSVVDPVQYSCQQNYTILSTDGIWNSDSSSDVVGLDGSTSVGNQDGALPRPYNDGSKVTTTIVTPYTSTQDRTTTTTASTLTRTWSRTTTVIGAACTATMPPSNTAAAPMDIGDSRQAALYRGSDPDGNDNDLCYRVESGSDVWFCRTGRRAGLPSGGAASVTGSNGKTWYLVSDIAGQSGCLSARSITGDSDFSSSRGVCPAATTPGNFVTQTPATQTDTLSGYSSTSVDRWEAVQTTTQTVVDGTPGAVGPLTPSTPNYTFTSNQSYNESSTSRSCGGEAAPPATCPSATGTWTAGTPTLNNVCLPTADQPAAGTSTPALASEVATGQTQGVVTNQVGTQVAGTPTSTSVGSGGIANTLADVAAYYYATNLRTSALGNCTGPTIAPSTTPNDLCTPNTVPGSGQDTATWQHMTTFTLGLGVRGLMAYSSTYSSDTSGDYAYVANGTIASSSTCSWRDALTVAGGPCNWPVPSTDSTANIDDLWHAAVNGRGTYFSATDPGSLAAGLTSTLKAIVNTPRPGTASAAATTNPKITEGNNFQFSSYFKTVEWSGELIRQTMNLTDGSVPFYDHMNPDPTTYDWSAGKLLDARASTDYTDRKIYTHSGSGSSLIPFTWADLSATQKAYFTTPHISTTPPTFPIVLTGLSQFCSAGTDCIDATAQANTTVATGGAAGEALVNFLRGDRANEEGASPDKNKFFRHRRSVLGDIVSAQPQYVGAPTRFYSDTNYAAFKTLRASRTPIVYTAANDGMLHAFSSATGAEAWAYIPGLVLSHLYTLADKKYAEKHQYFVEGTPVTADICPKAPSQSCADSEWRTILVAGLNGGGTGYYALDITDPANPALLWEFSDANMGYSFGKPQITKLTDGTWVVLLTSGYNNCPRSVAPDQQKCALNGTGDGQGYLYVLNAATGAPISGSPIAADASVGSVSSPSGLAQIIAQADSNNVSRRVYGGDLYGNVWRFSIEPGSFGSHRLALLRDADGNVQPVTVRPQVTTVNGSPVVYLGTGRYLGITDVGGTPKNSFYAIKDDLSSPTTYNNPRTYTSFIGQQATDGICPTGTPVSICRPGEVIRSVSQISGAANSNLTTQNGWFLDFPPTAGEIQFTDPRLTLGTLVFSTSVPKASTAQVCSAKTGASDGQSLAYMLDYLSGGVVGTSSRVIATTLGAGIATAPQIAQLPNGTVIAKYRLSTGQEVSVPLRFSASGGATKRISWRELVTE